MLRFLVPLLVTLSSATPFQEKGSYTRAIYRSAASPSQIKFAIENKYDDTGPGAKRREYAYNTYSNLEDALIAYLDDPDTKLPEPDKAKAVKKLLTKSQVFTKESPQGWFGKPANFHINTIQKLHFGSQEDLLNPFNFGASKNVGPKDTRAGALIAGDYGNDVWNFKFQKYHTIKGSPLRLAHYTRDRDLHSAFKDFDVVPKYSYSYGVNNKATGDVKQAAETRNGGTVHGFYSFMDSDGQQRTVHYSADDQRGFTARVKKSPTVDN